MLYCKHAQFIYFKAVIYVEYNYNIKLVIIIYNHLFETYNKWNLLYMFSCAYVWVLVCVGMGKYVCEGRGL